MAFDENSTLWFNGEYKRWRDATIHVMSHVIHYGSCVFEGLRCYPDVNGGASIFRLKEHIDRLYKSAKIYRMQIPYTEEELCEVCVDVLRKNEYKDAYIRPFAFRGYGTLGVDPRPNPVDVVIGAWVWGKYLGSEALDNGVDVRVSSWAKPAGIPALSKAGGHYLNSQLVKMEAAADGYIEGILLDQNGYVSEGSGENIFILMDGKCYTSPIASSILKGITRDCAMTFLKEEGIELQETFIPREMLYLADEIFFTGTAAEITPIRSIDKVMIGNGKPGDVTKRIQKRYFDVINGKVEDKYNWLTRVY